MSALRRNIVEIAEAKKRGRYHKGGELSARLELARMIGWGRGYSDKHCEERNFATGAEYLAWLAGWRAGQAERKRDQEKALRQIEDQDRVMRRILEAGTAW